jgi:hypothetical protein
VAKELEWQPEKILEKIPGAIGLAMGMAKTYITSSQIYLPCRLDLPLLETFCHEIKQMSEVIENKNQFARALPRLTKYLNSYPVVGLNNTSQWMEKLAAVSKDIERAYSMGEKYSGLWDRLFQTYLVGKDYEDQLAKEATKSELEKLHRYQEEARIRRGQKPPKIEPTPASDPDAINDLDAAQKQLSQFLSLYETHQHAQNLVVQYREIKDLMMRAISLPAAESDLLMRYQTTLERRLSSAIGELLALQRAKKPELGT